jgi:hypothetical protein
MSKPRNSRPTELSGRDARQGDIVLDTRPRRWIFIAGLVGIVVLIVLLRLLIWR